jgi:archaellum component FlaG (FlaF/FlaG flagellin family)
LRIRLQKGFFTSIVGLTLLAVILATALTAAGVFTYYYVKYSRAITARLSGHVLQNTTQIFSAPEALSAGQPETLEALTTYLTRVGYRPEEDDNALGQFTVQGNTVDIRPSKLSTSAGPTP